MKIEKYQWNFIVAGELDDLDDSSFSRNLLSLLETQMMEVDFQIEVQTSIKDFTKQVRRK